MSICGKCDKTVGVSTPSITCNGFCDLSFHHDCVTVDRATVNILLKNKNMLWLCNDCRILLASITKKGGVSVQNIIADKFLRLEQEIASNRKVIEDLCQNIGQHIKIDHHHNSQPDLSSGQTTQPTINNVVIGTADVDSESSDIISAVTPKKWLFVSRISSSTTDEQFKNFVNRKFQISSTRCHRIEPRPNDRFVKDYISYKIAVDPTELANLLLPSSWPHNILVKEYEIRRGNFRQQNRAQFRD